MKFASAPQCPICAKSVYKMEEIQALNKVWHKACFTCGGSCGDGCGRTLSRDKYHDHSNAPYCDACYGRLFRPKGVGFGANLSTSAGSAPPPAPAATTTPGGVSGISTVNGTQSVPLCRPSTGSNADITARLSADSPIFDSAVTPPPPPPPPRATPPSAASTPSHVLLSSTTSSAMSPPPWKHSRGREEVSDAVHVPPTVASTSIINSLKPETNPPRVSRAEALLRAASIYQGDSDEVDESEW